MLKDIKAILFDLDGTLLDTTEFIYQAFEHALANHKYDVSRHLISKHSGKPIHEMYEELTNSHEHTESLIEKHKEFQLNNMHLADIFPGAIDTLKVLREKGYKIGAVTTRFRVSAETTLRQAGMYDLFDVVVCGDDARAFKPDPAPLLLALDTLKEKPEHAVMVGDSYIDVLAGKNTGTKTVRAVYGFNQELIHEPEPDYFLEDIRDILKIL